MEEKRTVNLEENLFENQDVSLLFDSSSFLSRQVFDPQNEPKCQQSLIASRQKWLDSDIDKMNSTGSFGRKIFQSFVKTVTI